MTKTVDEVMAEIKKGDKFSVGYNFKEARWVYNVDRLDREYRGSEIHTNFKGKTFTSRAAAHFESAASSRLHAQLGADVGIFGGIVKRVFLAAVLRVTASGELNIRAGYQKNINYGRLTMERYGAVTTTNNGAVTTTNNGAVTTTNNGAVTTTSRGLTSIDYFGCTNIRYEGESTIDYASVFFIYRSVVQTFHNIQVQYFKNNCLRIQQVNGTEFVKFDAGEACKYTDKSGRIYYLG